MYIYTFSLELAGERRFATLAALAINMIQKLSCTLVHENMVHLPTLYDFVLGSLIENFCHCPSEEYVCVNSANVSNVCQHICDASNYECGEHGVCIYDVISKKPTCQ